MKKKGPAIRLDPMSEEDFASWIEDFIEEYAATHIRVGNWLESEAREKSKSELSRLLPDGINTAGHRLFLIMDPKTEAKVGVLWMAAHDRGSQQVGFIYDLEIDEQYRRKGYATAAMTALEQEAEAMGISRLVLNVFAYNTPAKTLYDRLGYETISLLMAKKLRLTPD